MSAHPGDLRSPTESALARRVLLVALLLGVAAARLWVVLNYGNSLPFWDQWGGENGLFRELSAHRLGASALLAAHNEHRILWTRLLTLLTFELNSRQWDNAVEAVVNIPLYVGAMAVPAAVLLRSCKGVAAALLIVLWLALGALPYGWENSLIGFQSQFYLFMGLGFATIYGAAFLREGRGTSLLVVTGTAAGLVTMASGTLTGLVVAAIVGARVVLGTMSRRRGGWVVAGCLALSLLGIITTPTLSHHEGLRPRHLSELLRALRVLLSWPLPSPALWILWAPVLVVLVRSWRSRSASRADLFFLGLAALTVLQAGAIAAGRGVTERLSVTSRYTDCLAGGVLANGYFALQLGARARGLRRSAGVLASLAYCVTLLAGLAATTRDQRWLMEERAYFTRTETVNVARFLAGDSQALDHQPHEHIPYPEAAPLVDTLQDPVNRLVLPPAVQLLAASIRERDGSPPDTAATAADRWHLEARPCTFTLGPDAPSRGASGSVVATCVGRRPAAGGPGRPSGTEAEPAPSVSAGILSVAVARTRGLLLRQWRSFAPVAPVHPFPVPCGLDAINDVSTQAPGADVLFEGAPLRLTGWVGGGGPPAGVRDMAVALRGAQGTFVVHGRHRIERPDVRDALRSDALLWSGFDVIAGTAAVPAGWYRVLLSDGGGSRYCDSGHDVEVQALAAPGAEALLAY
jgi:hypothetical protein